jgi:hypothetical protein
VKRFWRIASLTFVALMFLVLVPLPWDKVDWGTAPEWLATLALVVIAGGVWRVAVNTDTDRRERVRSRRRIARELHS